MKKIKRIDGEQRFYEVGGKQYPSVTTIMGIMEKPFLRQWAANQTIEYLKKHDKALTTALKRGDTAKANRIYNLARTHYLRTGEKARDIGSEVHGMIEQYINVYLQKIPYPYWMRSSKIWMKKPKKVRNCFDAFGKWMALNDIKFLKSEMIVYSKKHKYAGTLDGLAFRKDKKIIVDYKSSNQLQKEDDIQLSSYKEALEEMTKHKIDEMWLIRLGKKDGSFQAKQVLNHSGNIIAFNSAHKIWLWKQKRK